MAVSRFGYFPGLALYAGFLAVLSRLPLPVLCCLRHAIRVKEEVRLEVVIRLREEMEGPERNCLLRPGFEAFRTTKRPSHLRCTT